MCAAEATVSIKQEKIEEESAGAGSESEKSLYSCFCPDGYSTATSGHYHCRHCGISSRYMQNITRHENVHRDFMAYKANPSQQQKSRHYYKCHYCGFVSKVAKSLRQHEKRLHAKFLAKRPVPKEPEPAANDQELQVRSETSRIQTADLLETTARLRVSSNCTIFQFSLSITDGLHHCTKCNLFCSVVEH